MNDLFSCSLIIATYNWPEALQKCLESAFEQQYQPIEILIADDGSDERTAKLIAEMKTRSSVPLIHVWHPDEGFRLGEIRNKAISTAKGDYIIQIDGDILMERHFIADHLRMAKKNTFLCGSRVLLQPALSKRLLGQASVRLHRRQLSLGYVLNSIRLPFAGKLLADVYKRNQPTALRGCNMSFWRTDLLAVNGYNADMKGWGREDAELAIRLINAGIRKRFLKFMAIAYHLYHPENSRDDKDYHDGLLQKTIDQRLCWTKNGIQTSEK
ncbi:N-terminal domain of galactosyltransferase [bacterium A37T11]|nr:N-terminal domain of galactosyltransferase [bacterium A37T11]